MHHWYGKECKALVKFSPMKTGLPTTKKLINIDCPKLSNNHD